jgi:anti-sigma-K factor RskA
MTPEFSPQEEQDLLAAELALGLLTGEDLLTARGRAATDPAFAAGVEAWELRLAPMLDAVPEAKPPEDLWDRIERRLNDAPAAGADVVQLQRSARRWRGIAGLTTALAASLALILGLRIAQPEAPIQPQQPAADRTMAASLASDDGGATLAVAFEPDRGTMVVTPTRMLPASGHDHELWLIPAGGAPVSLGLVRAGVPQRHRLPHGLAASVSTEAQVALSVEPTGGSPTGQPTGPVIASAPLTRI